MPDCCISAARAKPEGPAPRMETRGGKSMLEVDCEDGGRSVFSAIRCRMNPAYSPTVSHGLSINDRMRCQVISIPDA